jgi:hypothetical protein
MTARRCCLMLMLTGLLLGCGQARAGSAAPLIQTAREQWAAGRFAAAGDSLEAAYRAGAQNAAVCLAAAQAWRRADDKGRLVLWLARANRLEPENREAKKALDAAGATLSGPTLVLTRSLSPRGLAWLVLAANTAWWFGLALARLAGWRTPRRVALATGVLVGWLWLEAGAGPLYRHFRPQGVVLADTAARCAPEAEAEILFSLPAGLVVDLGPSRDGYRQVMADGERVGWLPTAGLEGIAP